MRTNKLGWSFFAAAMSLSAIGGCSLLLDTEKLKEGAGPAAETDSGTDSSIDSTTDSTTDSAKDQSSDTAADTNVPKKCTSADDCDTDHDPCTFDSCDTVGAAAIGTCAKPIPWTNKPAIQTLGEPTVVFTDDKLAVPVIFSDSKYFYIAILHDGAKKGVAVFRYEIGNTSEKPKSFDLGELAKAAGSPVTAGYLSSPGAYWDSKNRVFQLIVAAESLSPAIERGVYKIAINSDDLAVTPSQQHMKVLYKGFDADGYSTYPRQYASADNGIIAMWPFNKGFVHCATVEQIDYCDASVLPSASVVDVIPLEAPLKSNKYGAFLESNTLGSEGTKLWTNGVPGLTELQSGGSRYGISAAQVSPATAESGPLNVFLWSYLNGTTPRTELGAGDCNAADGCEAYDLAVKDSFIGPAVYPHLETVTGLTEAPEQRFMMMQMSATITGDNAAFSALLLAGAHVAAGKEGNVNWDKMSPETLTVALAIHDPDKKPGSVIGRSVSYISPQSGETLVAWIQYNDQGKPTLYSRRYQIAQCK